MKRSNWVLSVVAVDAIALGILIPLLPYYVEFHGGEPYLVTQLVAVYSLAILVSAPILGNLADFFGRKRVILVTLLIAVLGHLGITFGSSLLTVFVFRSLLGFAAGNEAVVQALLTDNMEAKQHASIIGRISAARGFGMMIGPILGGVCALLAPSQERSERGRGGEG